jgi:hypothetical protein
VGTAGRWPNKLQNSVGQRADAASL